MEMNITELKHRADSSKQYGGAADPNKQMFALYNRHSRMRKSAAPTQPFPILRPINHFVPVPSHPLVESKVVTPMFMESSVFL
jgi:hypothetical protein